MWDEVPFPEDLEEENERLGGYVDDEEFYDPSGGASAMLDTHRYTWIYTLQGLPIDIMYFIL